MKKIEELITPLILPVLVCLIFGFLTQICFNTISSNFFGFKEMRIDTGVSIWIGVFMLVFLKNLLFQNNQKEVINYNYIMNPSFDQEDLDDVDDDLGNLP